MKQDLKNQLFQIQFIMSEIITKINREKGFDYRIDKDGNVIKYKYSWIKDKTTLIMLAILLLGGLYYVQMSQSVTNAENFDEYCMIYSNLREDFILNNPGIEININNVLEYYEKNRGSLNEKLNILENG